MRKWLVILILIGICTAAYAEIPCQCAQAPCLCFIQLGDEGPAVEFIQNALITQGYLSAKEDASTFDARTVQAVQRFQTDHSLPPTGVMDDETLTLLLWGMLPEELDQTQPLTSTLPVWIPTDGGIRHHDTKSCSQMFDPRLVSQRNALLMNMLHWAAASLLATSNPQNEGDMT